MRVYGYIYIQKIPGPAFSQLLMPFMCRISTGQFQGDPQVTTECMSRLSPPATAAFGRVLLPWNMSPENAAPRLTD